jgi:hypothetical protein
MNILHYIESHPSIALVVGGVHLAIGHWLHTIEIPTIIMQLFQIGAWSVTISVGLITIYGFFKKTKK